MRAPVGLDAGPVTLSLPTWAAATGIAEAAKCIAITYLDVRALDTVLP